MEVLELLIEEWEALLDGTTNYETLHYIVYWYDMNRCPIEYLPFMFSYDFDY